MKSADGQGPWFLGIEGGGTRTVAILAGRDGGLIRRIETGPANLKLLDDRELQHHLKTIAGGMPHPGALAIGLAGTWCVQDCQRILKAAAKVWPRVPCHASNDLETALAAAADSPGSWKRVLVLSGTGSCCYAKTFRGEEIKVGSGGHVVADIGSAYQMSVAALRGVFACFEEQGHWPALGSRLLAALEFNEPDDLITWAATATKPEMSTLALEVLRSWQQGDGIAKAVVTRAASELADEAKVCMRRAGYTPKKTEFVLSGSMLLKQARYRRLVASKLRRLCPGCRVAPLQRESAWGAVELARRLPTVERHSKNGNRMPVVFAPASNGRLSPTETRNPRSTRLDKLPISGALALMLSEEEKIPPALLAQSGRIQAAIHLIVRSLRSGGRLFYAGAGTSGRLGVLDASECPPTFRTSSEMVQGIIAGGQTALWRSVEGAEDNPLDGARAVRFRGAGRKDVVVGITASGTTPFVWGAIDEARRRGAATILICFNPSLRIAREHRPTVVISPDLGPEILTGSTRLKAGTATKLLLNAFTTIAMVRLGKVVSNLMTDLNPSNAKLQTRAVRIVCDVAGVDAVLARAALERKRWVVRDAIRVATREKQL